MAEIVPGHFGLEPLLRRHWRTLASKAAVREFDTQTKQ